MPRSAAAGDLLAGRFRLDDLLTETRGGLFWRAHDTVLHRPVSVHILDCDDERAERVMGVARAMGPLADRRVLRVLDADQIDQVCYVVHEWGQGEALDDLLLRDGPQPPRRAAWLVSEVADSIAAAHEQGLAHGRLVPENILIDHHGHVRIIGFGVESVLHGTATPEESTDVRDLGALLHAALTGKWAGSSQSMVPPAPVDGSTVLRPRRVRAGIPRQLDALCDEVLNGADQHRHHRGAHDLGTARGIADALMEFVGDPTGVQAALAGQVDQITRRPTPAAPPPLIEAPPAAPETPGSVPEPDQETVTEPPAASPPVSADLPTEAGMPVFHDDTDEVEWMRARAQAPAPPPPLGKAEAKPLFAPDPPQGQPVRRPRPGAQVPASEPDYWPWDTSSHGSTGGWPVDTWGTADTGADTGDHVPGRSWIRLAMLVGMSALVLLAAVAAYQLGLGQQGNDDPDEPTTGGDSPGAVATPFEQLAAVDFDPQGAAPREENPDLVPLAIDGDTSTSWRTATYRQNFGPGGLKSGVGLVVDLGATRGVREVAVAVEGGQTDLAAFVTQTSPTGVADLSPVGEASGDGELLISLDEAVSGQYVTVWLTSLPAVDGGFRGVISEVEVRG